MIVSGNLFVLSQSSAPSPNWLLLLNLGPGFCPQPSQSLYGEENPTFPDSVSYHGDLGEIGHVVARLAKISRSSSSHIGFESEKVVKKYF